MRKVVIIDDEKDILEIMHINLSSFFDKRVCFEVYSNPCEFIEMARLSEIDIIISDINMPFLSGIELYKLVRSAGFNKSFIFHTGYVKDYLKDLMEIKDCYYFTKPTNFDYLFQTIENIFMIDDKVDFLLNILLSNVSQLTQDDFEKKYNLYKKLVSSLKIRQLSVEKLAS